MPTAGMLSTQIKDPDEWRGVNEKALNEFRSGQAPCALVLYLQLE